ncbi:MAG: HigA family addiction module antitoxin [Nitrospirota bacterium]|nr:HigA family addiction module antitoxin [Nitrospirota bacterium]
MSKRNNSDFKPDYAVSPGDILLEFLENLGMTQAELADRMGLAPKTVNEIIKAKAPITPETALKLERVFGRPAHFWNNLEQNFQEDRARLAEQSRLRVHLSWLKKVPVKEMAKLGWIQKFSDSVAQLTEVVRFFGIASPEQWQKVWREYQVAYRQSRRFAPCAEAVSAWLRQGEIEAQRITCATFDAKRFLQSLDSARTLTREEPQVFQSRLVDLCAGTGVAVVFVPELPKTGVFGAVRWLGTKAVIQLSLHYKSNDHLWFTFFHEAGHIIKHGRKEVFLEGNGMDSDKDEEANTFAREKLIPSPAYKHFLSHWNKSLTQIENFAREIDIAPGIVVGRLQHDGHLPRAHGNGLKVYYHWAKKEAN